MAATEHSTPPSDRAPKPANLGPDVIHDGDGWHAFLDGMSVAPACSTSSAAWAAARRAATIPTRTDDPRFDYEMARARVARTDLGGGLSCDTIRYTYHEPDDTFEAYGYSEAYALQLPHGELVLEIDISSDFHRNVGMIETNGRGDHHFSAAEWLQIADLLRRDEMYAALKRWAHEDAKWSEAEAKGRS